MKTVSKGAWGGIILAGAAIAAAAIALDVLDYRHAVRDLSTEAYLLITALAFTGLGAFAGWRLTRRGSRGGDFTRNDAAIRSLGLSPREMEALLGLAAGASNKEIARSLGVSPNTVKTHLSSLYQKLGVSRRTQAVDAARRLSLIP
ncbi:MAG: winged helix-turn-helix transcriptional regulator [Alphaproteobacteria bacterium]|nr:winged helix-turn-helix transcriptional regulator [Alphaproteobacteria bacterium]